MISPTYAAFRPIRPLMVQARCTTMRRSPACVSRCAIVTSLQSNFLSGSACWTRFRREWPRSAMRARPLKASGSASRGYMEINGYRNHLFPYLLFGPSLYLFSPWWRYSRFRLTCYHRVSVSARSVSPTATRGRLRRISRGVLPWLAVSARSVSPLATRVRLRARHRLRLCFQDSACINR